MICLDCAEETETAPCAGCGEDPLLDGRYRLERVLGRGAAGTTYLATVDGQQVAIKESLLRRHEAKKSQELVQREAKVLQQLQHPQIPAYVDQLMVGSGKSRSLCLVQEYVNGVDLQTRLVSHRYTEDEVLETIRDLCPVLSYLHGLSPPVVHRDLKPANIIRTPEGRLVLVDFGSVRDALKNAQLGGSTVAGTFGFMAPEQFAGDAEARSDLYGLGALAVALLTRQDPASLQGPDRRVQWHEHAQVSAGTAGLIDDLLSLRVEDRPPTAGTVASRVSALLVGEPPEAVAAAVAEPTASLRSFAEPERPSDDIPEPFFQAPVVFEQDSRTQDQELPTFIASITAFVGLSGVWALFVLLALVGMVAFGVIGALW